MNYQINDSGSSTGKKSGHRVDLTTSLYGELRRLAAAKLASQPQPQTLQATALVHEAWLRLGGEDQGEWNDREHYFASVALAMRHILVDRARRRNRMRHGAGYQRVTLNEWNWENLDNRRARATDDILLLLDDLVRDLEEIDAQTGRITQLHYFAGLSIEKVSSLMDLSERTVKRRLSYARSWLNNELRRQLGKEICRE